MKISCPRSSYQDCLYLTLNIIAGDETSTNRTEEFSSYFCILFSSEYQAVKITFKISVFHLEEYLVEGGTLSLGWVGVFPSTLLARTSSFNPCGDGNQWRHVQSCKLFIGRWLFLLSDIEYLSIMLALFISNGKEYNTFCWVTRIFFSNQIRVALCYSKTGEIHYYRAL